MYQPIETYEKASAPLFATHSILFASALCDTLEKAGIPSRLHNSGDLQQAGRYSVDVPVEFLADSLQLVTNQTANV
jgi:hypothetical protein